MKISEYVGHNTARFLARLFHAQLVFHGSHARPGARPVGKIMKKDGCIFMKLTGYGGYLTWNNLKQPWCVVFKPLYTVFLSSFCIRIYYEG